MTELQIANPPDVMHVFPQMLSMFFPPDVMYVFSQDVMYVLILH